MLAVLLAPHQNCRYQASIEQLSRVELQLTLNAVGLDAQVCERVYAGHTALCVDAPCDDERLNRLLSGLSSAYMVCRAQPDGALYPLYGRKAALLGEDLSVTETGIRCGFSDPTNFFVRFKQVTGLTPSAYRKTMLRGTDFRR